MPEETPNILKKIIARKHLEVAESIARVPLERIIELSSLANKTRGFFNALQVRILNHQSGIIAEIKKASPSKGVLRENFNPVEIAKSYEKGGASCLSILTDRDFFQGDPQYLISARAAVSIPVIRKDFIIHPYQVYESRAMGADCILLIASCLNDEDIKSLSDIALSLSMDVLIEVHNLDELERAQKINLPMIGINNRNLHNFEVTLQTTIDLIDKISDDKIIITESGITSKADIEMMHENNVFGFLVGEAFMRHPNPGQQLKEFFK